MGKIRQDAGYLLALAELDLGCGAIIGFEMRDQAGRFQRLAVHSRGAVQCASAVRARRCCYRVGILEYPTMRLIAISRLPEYR